MWEKAININEVKEIRAKSTVYLGVGAVNKIGDILQGFKRRNINKILVVAGKNSYKISGAWGPTELALNNNNIEYKIYDKVTPNPTTHQVDEATNMGLEFGAQAILCIGGGSPIDAGKSVAIMLKYPNKSARELYEGQFVPEEALPIVTINLTHGTGTEADRFAVASIPETQTKPAIAYDCIYPMYSINDPALCTKLPKNQTIYVTLDALNHVIEASTAVTTNPMSILMAKETARLIAKYLPVVMENPEDLTARYYLMYAAMIAGISFDNGLLHFTHALEHPLSGIKPELAHGLGLAMLLPSVIGKIYPSRAEVLADVLEPIVPGLNGRPNEANKVAVEIEKWLFSLGVKSKLADEGFSEQDIKNLTAQVFETPSLAGLVALAPIAADKKTVEEIYRESLKPLSVVAK